ncbi:GNAT family N-acetyltransferase [Corallococcus exercitus]|uniref:GNAT family N-acetyltransferase n=1 Tax=Corallococcus exercitus TaxID=2316736 RepID=A0A7Y4KRF6_9BACT|nr:GNAT family N-acetyltransferase [Corallococcus exercitus]NOK38566.1 GNAT family N-acetyltransferase [Corallococcus exercitus]
MRGSSAERLSSVEHGSGGVTVREAGGAFWKDGGARDWDCWVPEGHFNLSQRFLKCAQHIQMEGFHQVPVTLSDGRGQPVGVAATYRNTIDGADLGNERIQQAVHLVRGAAPRFLKYGVIEVGNPAGVGFPVRSSLSSTEAITTLARWAQAEAERQRSSLVVIRDIEPTAAPGAVEVLRRLGFVPSPLPAAFVVPLPFTSFNEYKAHMRARYRGRLAGCMKETASLRVEVVEQFAELAPQLTALWRTLYDRATQYRRLVLTEGFFASASDMPEAKVMLLRRPDESVAGFGLLFVDGPMLRFSCTGFSREAALEEGVYFRLLYEVVRYAIEHGCKAVNMGMTTAGPKMSVGAQPVHVSAWIWHRSALQRQGLGWLTQNLMKPPPPVERNVFKEDVPVFQDPALSEQPVTARP